MSLSSWCKKHFTNVSDKKYRNLALVWVTALEKDRVSRVRRDRCRDQSILSKLLHLAAFPWIIEDKIRSFMDKNKVMELFVTDVLDNDHFVMHRENDQLYTNSMLSTNGLSEGIWKWKKNVGRRYGINRINTMTLGMVDGEISSIYNCGIRGDEVPPWWKRDHEPFYKFGDELVWGGGIDPRVWKSWLLRDPIFNIDFSSMNTRGCLELKDPRFHPGDYRYNLGNDPEILRLADHPPTEVEFRKSACPYALIEQNPGEMCSCGNSKQNHEYNRSWVARTMGNAGNYKRRKRNKDGSITEKLPWYGHNLDKNADCEKCFENVALCVGEKAYMFQKRCAFTYSKNSRCCPNKIEKLFGKPRAHHEYRGYQSYLSSNVYPPVYPPLLPKYRKQTMGRLRRERRKQVRKSP